MGFLLRLFIVYLVLLIIDIYGLKNKKWILFSIITGVMIVGVIVLGYLWLKLPEGEANPIVFGKGETDDYSYVIYEDKEYVPYCAFSPSERDEYLGYVEEDMQDEIYSWKNHSTDEWLINYLNSGMMNDCMLLKEKNVTNIPEGLTSEYKWNHTYNKIVEQNETDNTITDITETFNNEESQYYSGKILEISNQTITFENYNHKKYKIDYDSSIKLLDGRTEENIQYEDIKVNDSIECNNYPEKAILIATKKTGEELKKDLLKNLTLDNNRINSIVNSPEVKEIRIESPEKAIIIIALQDLYGEMFDNEETFEIDILLNSNTKITSRGGLAHSIETLNNAAHDIVDIVLDKDTLNDKYPVVLLFSSSDS